jgi:hypothetical protein
MQNNSKIIGFFFLMAIVTYATGTGLTSSLTDAENYLTTLHANPIQMGFGAILMLLNSVAVMGIGILSLPILKPFSKNIAYTYFAGRAIEATLLAVGILFLLLQIPISQAFIKAENAELAHLQQLALLAKKANFYAYQIAMFTLGLGSIFFCYALYQAKLLPKPFALFGLIGYVIFLIGAIAELLGFPIGLMLSIPGGLFELFLGVWLMWKGFDLSNIKHEIL